MSSLIGHSLTAAAMFAAERRGGDSWRRQAGWLAWLVVLASAPDADYVFSGLSAAHHDGIRITHSIAFASALPLVTSIVLFCGKFERAALATRCAQEFAAGLSHLLLDFLVGARRVATLLSVERDCVQSRNRRFTERGRGAVDEFLFLPQLAD